MAAFIWRQGRVGSWQKYPLGGSQAKNIYYLAFYRKSLPATALGQPVILINSKDTEASNLQNS